MVDRASGAADRNRLLGVAVLIGVVAAFLRVCNLGTFSLWLDEVFTMRVASKPLLDTLAACAADAENVPFYAVVTNLGLRAGLDDPWIRLIPITAALVSIALLAVWTDRHFGRSVALLTAAFCALSSFHVRYSQELRAYPYLLLICTVTLLVADRLRARPDWRSVLALAATVAVGCYTNLTYVLVLVPVAGLVFAAGQSGSDVGRIAASRIRLRYLTGVSLGVIAFVPWLVWTWTKLGSRLSRPRTTEWSWQGVGDRWQALTIAVGNFDRLTWFGVVLALFFVVGVVAALRMRVGRAVLIPALATLLGWEVVLQIIEHWSAARYDTALWPFIAILVALGFERILRFLRWKWLCWAACGAVAVMLLVHVDAYHRRGRPHWDRLAEAVREVRRPGEKLVTIQHFSRTCLTYYLGEPITAIDRKPKRLRQRLEGSESLLVVSRSALDRKYLRHASAHAELTGIHRTARLYRLVGKPSRPAEADSTNEIGRPEAWPQPIAAPVSPQLEQMPTGCLGRLFGRPRREGPESAPRLEFNPGDWRSMRSGWEAPSTLGNGVTVAWVLGLEASVDIARVESTTTPIKVRLWPHRGLGEDQWVRVLLNDHVLGIERLKSGPQIIEFDAPSEVWRDGRNLLVLQFSRVCCEGSKKRKAAAVDWIKWGR
jgi:hypothetical protein